MSAGQYADWCEDLGDNISICGVDEEEVRREPWGDGPRWCFHCRKRHDFWWVVYAPKGLSWYGPRAAIEGEKYDCTDLFPGWEREWEEG